MNPFQPHIIPVYPPHNELIFEEWFAKNYVGCNTDRELIPAFFTSYWVNHDYGNDSRAKQEMQEFVDGLDRSKKWFCITQYDDSVLIDFKDLDILRFEMSKNIGLSIPLLCQPHPYKFTTEKKWLANFVGGRTHPIRNSAERLKDKEGYFISFESYDIEMYCRILHESVFTLCYRGYGASSFRIAEALQYYSIPVYISNEFIFPYDIDFNYFGVIIEEKDIDRIDEILGSLTEYEILEKQWRCRKLYEAYYTYQSNLKLINRRLEIEFDTRKNTSKAESFIARIIETGD